MYVIMYQYQLSGRFCSVSKCLQIATKKLMDFGRPHSTYKVAHSHSDVHWNASANLNMFSICLSELLLYLELYFFHI